MLLPEIQTQLWESARNWQVTVQQVRETAGSLVAFGLRHDTPVVLKATSTECDEADTGAVAAAFAGQGMVKVYEHARGSALFERLQPGNALSDLVFQGHDDEATGILAGVVSALHTGQRPVAGFRTAADWGMGFDWYVRSGDQQIPADRVQKARAHYHQLCQTQKDVRLLHGDLQHYNVLYDRTRGWTAIDPKGVVAELEFELGAALRNPWHRPELYSSWPAVQRRVTILDQHLRIEMERVLGWAYAQSVLSAIWTVEDRMALSPDNPSMLLAQTLEPLLA